MSRGFSPSATATAALRRTNINASLFLLNRASDCFASALNVGVICGEDFLSLGLNSVYAGGGIYMSSSNASGVGLPRIAAGTVTGLATVTAPFTYLMGAGGIQNIAGGNQWTNQPVNGFPDGDYFTDPFAGLHSRPRRLAYPTIPFQAGRSSAAFHLLLRLYYLLVTISLRCLCWVRLPASCHHHRKRYLFRRCIAAPVEDSATTPSMAESLRGPCHNHICARSICIRRGASPYPEVPVLGSR